ncbi:hypothetical protein MC7420_2079 [Coleofasciculus chthonoplastes PCC 7420]|uniref:Uncharacterized protein n=1 Tax=Coleofasciculus chthonoplastes PCC 7420 TaxID=118168 RepID=B4VSE8_9CYAN|nr:hypothetical protein MC7420_2079 [Coleofasciculus chthonoplastes PCC 7420]
MQSVRTDLLSRQSAPTMGTMPKPIAKNLYCHNLDKLTLLPCD